MGKGIIIALCVLFLVGFLGVVIAVPWAPASYCAEMGYTYDNETCFFDYGTSCPALDFYNGTCGEEYVINVSCAEAGQAPGVVRECCEGLSTLFSYNIKNGECSNISTPGGYGTCSDCGNEICEDWEDKCNCPEDCEEDNETEECEWSCTDWSECEDEVKTRTCTNPDNCTSESPKESKSCKIDEIKEAIQERNRIRFENKTGVECADDCICTGRVMKCPLEDGGREMTVYAGSGNVIVQVKQDNMTTSVTLYHHNKTLYGVFKGNQTKEIKVLPDQVKEKVRERIQARLESFNMSLEDGYLYRVEAKKRARLFFIFPVREHIEAQVDPDTGEVAKIRNPWWGFLAKDEKE